MEKNLYRGVRIFLFFMVLLNHSCTEEKEKEKEPAPEIVFDYFEKNSATERYFASDGRELYITLPDCFEKELYYEFSLTNENNFNCPTNNIFFSVDFINSGDLDYYNKYFSSESPEKNLSSEELILEYIKRTRISGLIEGEHSIISEIKTFRDDQIHLVSVKGKSGNYSNSLFYQYGVIEIEGDLVLFQFIVNEDDIYFYHKDLMKIFQSIRKV
ncbi:MAG: hypothetical protein R3277_06380 [Brumimicrobium sp.]|nr:hypothetical protein [Brumimicrobium sp.]